MQYPRPVSIFTTDKSRAQKLARAAIAARTVGAGFVMALMGCGGAASLVDDDPSSAAAAQADPAPVTAFTSSNGGFTVSMPIPVRERLEWEGPVKMVLAGSRHDGAHYEVAYFDLPATLNVNEQASLVERVIVGLSNAAGVRVRALETTYTEDEPSTELDMEIRPERRGTWRLFFVDGQRMFQLSVLSTREDGHDLRAAEFFDSFHLDHRPMETEGMMMAGSRPAPAAL